MTVRRRRRLAPVQGGRPRPHRINLRFSDDELADIEVAAGLAGLTPTGWVAKCAVDVAAGAVRPAPTGLVEAMTELLETRRQVVRFSTLVNQAMAKWHATGAEPAELVRAIALVVRILPRLEEAAVAVRGAHTGRRRRVAPATASAPADPADPADQPLQQPAPRRTSA